MPLASHDTSGLACSKGYRRRVLGLLTLAYALNSADRSLIAIIAQPLKLDIQLSDAQLGLLMGTAFATLYAFSGLPIARLAERFNRVSILARALAAWSCLTALCAVAMSFPQLLLIRMGVGIGEAGCTPPAHSLVSDYYEPGLRSTALSVYSCGISLGYISSALVGGFLALHFGWRSACLAAGVPGLLLAIALPRLIAEPARGQSEPDVAYEPPPLPRLSAELAELSTVARQLFGKRSTAHVITGIVIATFAAQGSYAFIPAFFNRAFELDYARIGVISALTSGVAVGIGLISGGVLTDALGTQHMRWHALVPAIGLLLGTPCYVLSLLSSTWVASAGLLAIAGFFQYLSFGPTFGIVQNAVVARRRATASAVIYILLTLIGLGCGPLFTGWLIDRLAQLNFTDPSIASLGTFFRALGSTGSSPPVYATACLKGAALTPDMLLACRHALVAASRQGIAVTVLLYVWAALHYLLGARRMSPGPGCLQA